MKRDSVEKKRGQAMNSRWKVWLVGALLLSTMLSSTVQARPERNAYINRPAPNHTALMNQIRNDKVVMDRYMRHFAMTRKEVLNYFSGLRLTRLPKPYKTPMYNVPDNGELRSKVYTLRKGTLVWVDKSNTPILKESCGNPLTRGPEKPVANTPVVAAVEPPPTDAAELSTILPEGFTGDEVYNLTEAIEPGLPVVAMELQTPDMPISDTLPGMDSVPNPDQFVTPGESPIAFFDDLIPFFALPGLAIPFGFQNPGGPRNPPPPPPNPVPEPGTMLVLGLGAAWLAKRKRAKTAA